MTGSPFVPLSWCGQNTRPVKKCPGGVWWWQALGAGTRRWGSRSGSERRQRLRTTHLHHHKLQKTVACPPSSWGHLESSAHKPQPEHPRCFEYSEGKPGVPAHILGAWAHSPGLPCQRVTCQCASAHEAQTCRLPSCMSGMLAEGLWTS